MPADPSRLLSRLVVDAAERDPDRTALVDPDSTVDRKTLAERTARLAGALAASGVGPGDRVVVSAPKSVDSFVAVHAALLAGAVAAPVDPQTPAAVLADVARSLAPTAAVLGPATAARWPVGSSLRVTAGAAVDGVPQLTAADLATADPAVPVSRAPSDPAYLITTSGSTGRPKSIVHTHASGHRYAELAAECYGLTPQDRMASVAPFHFDQSTFELYAAPLSGATTVLVPDVLLRFPAEVSALLEQERVTTWYSVPTILRQLLERGALDRRDLSALRWVLFGGEVFPPAQLRRLMALLPAARFSNVYGPAEVNQCTFHHLDGPPGGDGAVPIGTAWSGAELRVVDAETGDVLDGPARGELHVRTATAMAGYWQRDDLTAVAFDGDWYRTGDLVDRDPAGLLTFLGRIDRQAKVRGVRVELESVEAALGSVEGIVAAAAVVVDDADAPLVGIVELAGGAAHAGPSEREIQQALRSLLPPAAVPDRIVAMPALPRGRTGKVDARAAGELLDEAAAPGAPGDRREVTA